MHTLSSQQARAADLFSRERRRQRISQFLANFDRLPRAWCVPVSQTLVETRRHDEVKVTQPVSRGNAA